MNIFFCDEKHLKITYFMNNNVLFAANAYRDKIHFSTYPLGFSLLYVAFVSHLGTVRTGKSQTE